MSTLKPFGAGKKQSRLEREFFAFHEKNPHVYKRLVSLARDLKKRGHTKCGIQMLYEVVRWQSFTVNRQDEYKMANAHCAYYARLIMEQEEDLAGFFNTARVSAI